MARQRQPINVEIMKILTDYTAEIGREINAAGERLAKQAQKELRKAPPTPKKTGDYAKSWKIKKFGKSGTFRIIIYNSLKPRLTHLLEMGFKHEPDKTFIEGRKHIRPVQEKLDREFEKAVEDIIKNNS